MTGAFEHPMSERPTAEAVGALFTEPLAKLLMAALGVAFLSSIADAPEVFFRNVESTDRLTAIDALRPPCPTCDGTTECWLERKGVWCNGPCPENGGNCDGKVSIGRMAATWNAVWRWTPVAELANFRPDFQEGIARTYDHLRLVKS